MSRIARDVVRDVGRGAAVAAALALLVAGCGGEPPTVPELGQTTSNAAAPPPAAEPTSTPAAGATGTPSGGPALCRSAHLRVTLGPSEGAAGTIYAPLRFTNTGTAACVLHGFPGVSYVAGDNGAQVGPAAERDGAKGAPVTLAPHAVASAMVAMVQVRNYDEAACQPTPVRGLRVYPPGETASVFVPVDGTGCAKTPPGPQLRVRTVQPGPGQN